MNTCANQWRPGQEGGKFATVRRDALVYLQVRKIFMPIYEYICQNCKQEFEIIRPMSQSDSPLACASCGRENIKRKLSLFHAESGGKSVAGTSAPSCTSCASGNCASCGH